MKDIKISKELLLEIMPLEHNQKFDQVYEAKFHNALNVGYHYDIVFEGKSIGYGAKHYNIYQIAFMLKEWAENKGYIIFSKNKECLIYSIDEVYDVIECLNQYEDYFEGNTEIEAIINACEWIIKETGN